MRILLIGVTISLLIGVGYAPAAQEKAPSVTAPMLKVPIYGNGQVQWELYLSNRDFLGWATEALQQLAAEEKLPLQLPNELLRWWFMLKPLAETLAGLEEVRVLDYTVAPDEMTAVMDFYDRQFPPARGWQRNFWMLSSGSSFGAVVYSSSEGGKLRQVAGFIINTKYKGLEVVAVRTRGFLDLKALVELLVFGGQLIQGH